MGAAINPCARKSSAWDNYKPVTQIKPQPPPSDSLRAQARTLYLKASYLGIALSLAMYALTLYLAVRAHRDESAQQSRMLMDYMKAQTNQGTEIDSLVMGIAGCIAISLVGSLLGIVSIFCRSKCGIALLTFQVLAGFAVFMGLSLTLLSYTTHYGPMVNEDLDTQCMTVSTTAAPTPAPVGGIPGIMIDPSLTQAPLIRPSTTWWRTSTPAAAPFFEDTSSSESDTLEPSSKVRGLQDINLVKQACADFGPKKWCADPAAFLIHLCEPPESGQAGTEDVSGPFNHGLALTRGTGFLGILAGLFSLVTSLFLCCLLFDMHTNRSALDVLMPAYLADYDAKRGNSKVVYESQFKPPPQGRTAIRYSQPSQGYPQQSHMGYPSQVAYH